MSKSGAKAAPITYKIDKGAVKTASLTGLPQQSYSPVPAPIQQRAPLYISPQPNAPAMPQAAPVQPVLPVPDFDQDTVDRELYAHQRIGKKYSIFGKSYKPKHEPGYDETGIASWYGDKFHGKPTATGERYNMNDLTAAHKTLPLNSMVYVTNLETGKGLKVRVNDRGPFVDGRIIDLSRASAQALGLFSSGLARVRVRYAGPADPMAAQVHVTPPAITPDYEQDQAPALVVETPGYTPLRELGTPPAEPVALPQQHFPFQPAAPALPEINNDWRDAVPTAPLLPSPQSVGVPQGDEPVTLTIKGPVHLASDKQVNGEKAAKFIPAVNYTTIPAKK